MYHAQETWWQSGMRLMVNVAQAAHAFSTGFKCRHCSIVLYIETVILRPHLI